MRLPPHPPMALPAEAAQARFLLFDAIASFWQRAAARQPLLLVLDDLHCADVSSLRLLEFVARESAASRVLLLGTYRDAEVTRTHPLSDTLGLLARQAGTQRLKLVGFSADETAQFIGAVGKNLPADLAAAMHERSDGHPLFLVEMARLLDGARGTLSYSDLQRVPAGVREVIGSRLNRLSERCIHVLGTGAVIGRRFDFDLLQSVLDEVSENQLLSVLDEARETSLIEELPEPAHYQFTHALVRDAMYDEIAAPRRMRLHQRIASTLERSHGDNLTPWLSALAHHFRAAGSAGGTEKAIEYATLAARQAEATLAYEEAARLYADAVQMTPPAREAERCPLLLALGEAQTKSAEHQAAIETFTEAAKIARRIAAPTALARAVLGYETCSWRVGGPGVVAAALAKEALEANSPLDSPQRVRLLAALCRALVFADRVDAAVAIHRQAVAMARRLNDDEALFAALSAIVPAVWKPELLALRLVAGREAMQLAERVGNAEWAVGHLTGFHICDLMASGDIEGAVRLADFGADATAVRQQPWIHLILIACRAMLAQHMGRFEEAERLAMEGMRHAAQRGQTTGAAAVQLFTLRREQGRLVELAPVLEHFQRTMPEIATWQPGYVVLCCELGWREQALSAFERLAGKGFAVGPVSDFERAGSLVYLAEACAWLGDAARARMIYEMLLPHAGSGIVFGTSVASLGCSDRVLGMLAATMGRLDNAEAHFERALRFDESSGSAPWLAHSRHEFAAMLLNRKRPGDVQRSSELLDEALAASRELGMYALEERVLALQQPAPHAGEPARYPGGLTAREVQVLQMVAEGKTNQDIATALFRSVNTVNNHVRNILAKIDAANRSGSLRGPTWASETVAPPASLESGERLGPQLAHLGDHVSRQIGTTRRLADRLRAARLVEAVGFPLVGRQERKQPVHADLVVDEPQPRHIFARDFELLREVAFDDVQGHDGSPRWLRSNIVQPGDGRITSQD